MPYLLYIVPIGWLTISAYGRVPGQDFVASAFIWIWSLTFYLKKFILPFVLVPLYQLPRPVSLFNSHYVLAFCLFVVLLFLVFRHKRYRWWNFAFLFYFVSIFCLLKYDGVDASIVADRYMYLPSVGLCLLFGVLCHGILERFSERVALKRFAYFCLIVILSALSTKAYFQARIWKDSLTLWNYVIRHSPRRAIAFNNRGLVYEDQGKTALAMKDYNKALEVNPYHASALNNRGALYEKQGKYDLALADYDKALAIDPRFALAYSNRGNVYFKKGLNRLAFRDFKRAIDIAPNAAGFYKDRGNKFKVLHQYDLALADYDKALTITPSDAGLYNNKGVVHTAKHQYAKALSDFNKAVKLNPTPPFVYYNRSVVYEKMGEYQKALEDALKAQSLGHELDDAHIKKLRKLISKDMH